LTSNRFALLVASSEYNDTRLRRLRSPAADAYALGEVLRDPRIGGYALDELINEPTHATYEAIEDFFKDRELSDQLLLYFSCHGIKDERGRLYFAAINTKPNRLASTALSSEFVAEQMQDCRARRIILILDCCYSGAFARGLRHRTSDNIDLDPLAGRGRAVLFASSAMEYAFEIDGSGIEGAGLPSLFTRTIVYGLRTGEADLDGDGFVSAEELYDHVRDNLRGLTPGQTPEKLIDAEGSIFVARSARAAFGLGALPKDIRAALSSPLVGVRKGVVEELEPLLNAGGDAVRVAARAALLQLSNDDSDRVAAAATAALRVRGVPADVVMLRPTTPDVPRASKEPVQSASTHTSGDEPVTQPLPALDAGATAMAEWVYKVRFPTAHPRPGYDVYDVDTFLDAVRDTFLGIREPPLTPDDVRNVQFVSTALRPNYDEDEVDKFLDDVELRLAARTRTAGDGTDAKKKPRPNLFSGAVGSAAEPSSTTTPVRSAAAVRDRFASFQRGLREGRAAASQARSVDKGDEGSA
jgi:DivIVA domain-containing protein